MSGNPRTPSATMPDSHPFATIADPVEALIDQLARNYVEATAINGNTIIRPGSLEYNTLRDYLRRAFISGQRTML